MKADPVRNVSSAHELLEQSFADYYKVCYPHGTSQEQYDEVRQAYMSGIAWMCYPHGYSAEDLLKEVASMRFPRLRN